MMIMAKLREKKWSQDVTENSDAMDLKEGVFRSQDPKKIADSLKRSAETSHRRKASPFQSAMSMLNLYINRAGNQLSKRQKTVLEEAKDELRKDFHREEK
jgi:putative cell wall-binding protein